MPLQEGSYTTTSGNKEAWISSLQDYYPFGLAMEGRSSNLGDYRYGFNSKERDPASEWGQTSYDYGFRIYNPGIGKFLSVDPLTGSYPFYTPYQFAGNKPIVAIDRDGLEESISTFQMDWDNRALLGDKSIGYSLTVKEWKERNKARGIVGAIGLGIVTGGLVLEVTGGSLVVGKVVMSSAARKWLTDAVAKASMDAVNQYIVNGAEFEEIDWANVVASGVFKDSKFLTTLAKSSLDLKAGQKINEGKTLEDITTEMGIKVIVDAGFEKFNLNPNEIIEKMVVDLTKKATRKLIKEGYESFKYEIDDNEKIKIMNIENMYKNFNQHEYKSDATRNELIKPIIEDEN